MSNIYNMIKSKLVMAKKKTSTPKGVPSAKTKGKKVVKIKIIRTDFNLELLDKLKEVRDKIAEARGVAGFIIFNDKVLKEMAYFYPTNKEEFLNIKGVGENKFNEFGSKFSKLIIEFGISSEELSKKHNELKKSVEVKPKINVAERTAVRKARVKELIGKKMGIEDMAHDLSLTATTIVNYIGRLLVDDPELDVKYIKESVEGYNDIARAFERLGDEKIGPIYAEFGGNVEYSDISLVKVLLLAK